MFKWFHRNNNKRCSNSTEKEYILPMNHIERVSPEYIKTLADSEVFVFASNLEGHHDSGAARIAREDFGAVYGQGVGLQGQCYAIPTMQGGIETIKPYVDEFIEFAQSHRELKFLVTKIGCGIAGFTVAEIAPLFKKCTEIENVYLPIEFWERY